MCSKCHSSLRPGRVTDAPMAWFGTLFGVERPAWRFPKCCCSTSAACSSTAPGLRELPRLLAAPMAPEDLRRKWVTSPAVGLFETGRCSEPGVRRRLHRGVGARHRARRIPRASSRAWVGAPYPETAELLVGPGQAGIRWRASATRTPRIGSRSSPDGRPEAGARAPVRLARARPDEAVAGGVRAGGAASSAASRARSHSSTTARRTLTAPQRLGYRRIRPWVPLRCATCSGTWACCSPAGTQVARPAGADERLQHEPSPGHPT